MNNTIQDALDDAEDVKDAAEKYPMPKSLRRKIEKALKKTPAKSWDEVLAGFAESDIVDSGD